jgi:hypothetical protein
LPGAPDDDSSEDARGDEAAARPAVEARASVPVLAIETPLIVERPAEARRDGPAPLEAARAVVTSRPDVALTIDQVWPRVVELASAARRLKNVVAEVSLLSLDNEIAIFETDALMLPVVHASRTDLEELLRRVCGRNFKAEIRPRSGAPARVPVVAGPITAAGREPAPVRGTRAASAAPQAAGSAQAETGPEADVPQVDPTSSPLVKEAIRVFGARVIGVQPRRHGPADGA